MVNREIREAAYDFLKISVALFIILISISLKNAERGTAVEGIFCRRNVGGCLVIMLII